MMRPLAITKDSNAQLQNALSRNRAGVSDLQLRLSQGTKSKW
jgi:hypothetical protein